MTIIYIMYTRRFLCLQNMYDIYDMLLYYYNYHCLSSCIIDEIVDEIIMMYIEYLSDCLSSIIDYQCILVLL